MKLTTAHWINVKQVPPFPGGGWEVEFKQVSNLWAAAQVSPPEELQPVQAGELMPVIGVSYGDIF